MFIKFVAFKMHEQKQNIDNLEFEHYGKDN